MQIYADRHALHQIPELDRNLPKTIAYLKNALSGLKGQGILSHRGGPCCLV